jgi:hypothetical protein
LGCENSTAQESPIHSWKLILPWVVLASKSGAVSLMDSPIGRDTERLSRLEMVFLITVMIDICLSS